MALTSERTNAFYYYFDKNYAATMSDEDKAALRPALASLQRCKLPRGPYPFYRDSDDTWLHLKFQEDYQPIALWGGPGQLWLDVRFVNTEQKDHIHDA